MPIPCSIWPPWAVTARPSAAPSYSRAGIPNKDKTDLVTTGIYRYSRNPAFLGFDFMYVGVLLMYGNLLTLGFSAFAMVMLHLQILQEERYLENTFGADYIAYKQQGFRYLGRKSF